MGHIKPSDVSVLHDILRKLEEEKTEKENTKVSLEWYASPEKVRSLYSS